MSQDTFRDRADALENAFFSDVDAKLLEKLRANFEKDQTIQELATSCGINDKHALEAMVEAGVNPRTLTALHLFPLIAVAWADNAIQPEERETVMEAASKQGLNRESPAGQLLSNWLSKKPSDKMFDAWETYAKALMASLDQDAAEAIRTCLEKELKAVAQAAGGVLGWAAVSKGESAVMSRVNAALKK